MGNVSIFDLVGQARPKKKAKKKKAKKKKVEKKTPGGWGTPVELYRRLCLLAQLCRYGYYVEHNSIITDAVYDKLESMIRAIEDKNREILEHRYSPTCQPGSDNPKNYPRSVHDLWAFSTDGPTIFSGMADVIDSATASACKAFDVKGV